MSVDLELADRVIAFLNELVELDREAVEALVKYRVLCNRELAGHPTVQVGRTGTYYDVGLVGLLNGLCGAHDENGWGEVAAEFEVNEDKTLGQLNGFRRSNKSEA